MKIKEVQAGIKITKDYNSYQASLTAEIETGEDPKEIGADLMEKASAIVSKKVGFGNNLNLNKKRFFEVEVGAAWFSKKSEDMLSVKMSDVEKWEDLKITDLEKEGEGYKQKTSEGVFIFKRIPDEKRKNNKMPMFRIYKLEDENGQKRD